ncbi:Lrp/AsnC family transcriptional regulator [Haloarchaeobius amylolyticus]|uniref:Lrp/AsnC family transcriptional regulator n=1 Tax=Haloarchaeobius amylolyticus TaxID=1198296 RepID=UPI00226E044D
MTLDGLDALDRRILHGLQQDARHVSSRDIAASIPASPSTVRKRIARLEENGIIGGYSADVDYDRAGYQLHVQIVCTAPVAEREAMSDAALSVPGVVRVRELATGERNVVVTVIGEDGDDLTRIATDLSDVGLTVLDEELVRSERTQPFSGFDPERSDARVRAE